MRKYLNLGVKIFISLFILLFVLSKIDKRLLLEGIKSASILWVLLFIFVGFINNLICSYRWWYLNSQLLRIDVPFITFFKLYYIGNFFNLFLPSTIGGDSVKGYYIYKFTSNKSSIHAVIIDRAIGLVAVVLFGIIGLLLARIYSLQIHILIYLLTGLITLGLLGMACVLFLFNKYQWKFFPKITTPIHNFIEDLSLIKNIQINRIIPLVFATIVFQLFTITNSYIASKAFGLNVPYIYFLILIPIITIVTLLPITFAGLGLNEFSYIGLFGLLNVSDKIILVPMLTFITLFILGLLGGYFYINLNNKPSG